MIYVGIDPGLDGAMAVLNSVGTICCLHDTPTLTVAGAKGNRREYDLRTMAERLPAAGTPDVRVFIEQVHAMPGQGVRSMFTMGYGLGAWEAIIAALGFAMTRVTPQRWKKTMLAGMGHDKDASRLRAMQLYPSEVARFWRKKDDGRAEALLIAVYGMKL